MSTEIGTITRGRALNGLATTLLVVGLLYLGREILIPLALAIFIAFLLNPLVRVFQRLRIKRGIAVVLSVGLAVGVLLVCGWQLVQQGRQIVGELPHYQNSIASKIGSLRNSAESTAARLAHYIHSSPAPRKPANEVSVPPDTTAVAAAGQATEAEKPVKVEVVASRQDDTLSLIRMFVGPVVHPAATLGIAIILTFFLLIYREDIRDRILRVGGEARIQAVTAALSDSGERVSRFLAAQALTNSAIGLITGVGLYFLGIPHAAVWGLFAAIFRFVPYLGTVGAALFPALLSIAIFDGWRMPMLVVGWCLAVDAFSAYLLEPWIFGARTGVAPLAIFLAFIFWGWLWGGIGLLLATPITVCLTVLGKHLPSCEFLSVLLSDQPVLEPDSRLYHRLLAGDRAEVLRIVEAFVKEKSPLEAWDRMILPALAQLECDRRAGLVDQARIDFVREMTPQFIEVLPESAHGDEAADAENVPQQVTVGVVHDRGAFDDVLPQVLGRLVAANYIDLKPLPSHALSNEIAVETNEMRAMSLVYMAVGPKDLSRLRMIAKRLRAEGWTQPIHAGLFTASVYGVAGARRFAREPGVAVHATLAGLCEGLLGSASMRLSVTPPSDTSQHAPRETTLLVPPFSMESVT